MPQLDFGIFFIEFFLNFLCFWFIYIFKAKNIFPLLNKSIKLRKYKVKKIVIFLNSFSSKFNYLVIFFKNNENNLNTFYLQNLSSFLEKLDIFNLFVFKFYFSLFLNKNIKLVSNFLKVNLLLNEIYKIRKCV